MSQHQTMINPRNAMPHNIIANQGQQQQQLSRQHEEFTCPHCDYKTPRKSNMTQHVRTVHERIKDFSCNQCEYKSARKSNVLYHIKTVHENIKDFACQFCNFKSARKYNVIQHSERVHKQETQGLEQKMPQNKIVVQGEVEPLQINSQRPTTRKSKKRAANTQQSRNVVTIPVVQQQQSHQQHHLNNQHTTTIITSSAPFTIDQQSPTMVHQPSNYSSMTLNYAHHQPMYNSPPTLSGNSHSQAQTTQLSAIPVTFSQVSTSSAGNLPSTMNLTGLQPLQYNQLAQQNFSGPSVTLPLNPLPIKKENQRTPPKEYICTFCNFKATKKKNLSMHLQTVHQANPVPNYNMNINSDLIITPDVVFPENNAPEGIIVKKENSSYGANTHTSGSSKPKQYLCSFCDFRTAYKRNQKAHINEVHLKERREHKCQLCEFKSTRKSNLAQHIKSVHERVKDHRCLMCGFTSSRKRNVDKHMMTTHAQKPMQHHQQQQQQQHPDALLQTNQTNTIMLGNLRVKVQNE